jgi:hypothetical protein
MGRRTAVSGSGEWKQLWLAAVLLAAVGASAILFVGPLLPVKAAPVRQPQQAARPALAADQAFAAICSANPVEDTASDPAWLAASFEKDNCWAPRPPVPLNGYTATRPQIVAAMVAVKTYLARADAFQKCIGNVVASRKAAAGASKSFFLVETHRVLVSEKNKKKASGEMDAAINAFNEYGSECAQ